MQTQLRTPRFDYLLKLIVNPGRAEIVLHLGNTTAKVKYAPNADKQVT